MLGSWLTLISNPDDKEKNTHQQFQMRKKTQFISNLIYRNSYLSSKCSAAINQIRMMLKHATNPNEIEIKKEIFINIIKLAVTHFLDNLRSNEWISARNEISQKEIYIWFGKKHLTNENATSRNDNRKLSHEKNICQPWKLGLTSFYFRMKVIMKVS